MLLFVMVHNVCVHRTWSGIASAFSLHLQGKYQQCQSSMGKNISISCLAKVNEGMHLQLLLQNYKDEILISEIFPRNHGNIEMYINEAGRVS